MCPNNDGLIHEKETIVKLALFQRVVVERKSILLIRGPSKLIFFL